MLVHQKGDFMNLLNSKLPLLFVVFSLFLITSCISTGTEFNSDAIAKLKPGMLEENVVSILGGQAQTRTASSNDSYVLIWSYSYSGFMGLNTEVKSISILFDSKHKMKKIMTQARMRGGYLN